MTKRLPPCYQLMFLCGDEEAQPHSVAELSYKGSSVTLLVE